MADEPVSPVCAGPALEVSEEMPQPEREIRGLRNDLRLACEVSSAQAAGTATALAGLRSDLDGVVADLHRVLADQDGSLARLDVEGGLPVRIAGQGQAVETVASGSTESASAENFEALEATVLSDAETTNSDLWGIAGLFVGFLTLAALYKVVRP